MTRHASQGCAPDEGVRSAPRVLLRALHASARRIFPAGWSAVVAIAVELRRAHAAAHRYETLRCTTGRFGEPGAARSVFAEYYGNRGERAPCRPAERSDPIRG